MNSNQRKPWTYHLIGILAGLALMTPLLSSRVLGGPVLLKGEIFQWIVLLMAAVWVVLMAGDERYRPSRRNPLVIAALAWLSMLILTLPFSLNPSLSFWSSRDRMSGVFNIGHWVLWFLILSSTYRTWEDWRKLLAGSNAVCLLIGTIGLLELTVNGPGYRIESTLGNAIYLSYYVLPHVFLSLMLMSQSEGRFRKVLWLGVTLIHVTVIVNTASRGAMLALLVGLLTAGIGYVLMVIRNRRQAMLAGLSLGIAILLTVTLLGAVRFTDSGTAWGKDHLPQTVQRILYHDFGSDRLSLWRMGLSGWMERPMMGRGLENYADVLDRHFDSSKDTALTENWYDRTHNQFIDMLIGTGLVGFLAYMLLWAIALWLPIREIRRTDDQSRKTVLWLTVPLILAQMVALFFAFDTPNASVMTWTAMAMVAGLYGVRTNRKEERRTESGDSDVGSVVFLSAVALIVGYFLYWGPYDQSRDYNKIMAGFGHDPEGTVQTLKERLHNPTFVIHDLNFNMMSRLKSLSENQQVSRERMRSYVEFGAGQMENITLSNRPAGFKAQLATAYALQELGTYDKSVLPRAAELAKRSVESAPNRPEGYEEMAEIEILREDYKAASEWLEKAMDASRHAHTDGRITMRRSAVLAITGDLDGAEAELQKAFDIGYDPSKDLRNITVYPKLMKFGEPRPVIMRYMEGVAKRFPQSLMAKATCAMAADRVGNAELVSRMREEMEKISPQSAANMAEYLSR